MKKEKVPLVKPTMPPKASTSKKAHIPAVPVAFPRPVFTNPFARGLKIRQDNRGKFFARTRRGSI